MILDISMWIWIPLALAIILAFINQTKASFALLGITLIGAIIEQRLNMIGLAGIAAGLLVAYKTPSLKKKMATRGIPIYLLMVHCIISSFNPRF